jgi:hypothetical protein
MADEVFALSPIAARPAQPNEADYDAIRDAFMETSRGRWFLGEYAKRNRNSDTRMVLDAVARIEETIAASRKPVRDPLLDEALASLRSVLAEARDAATAAVSDLALEQNLAPVRKGARVIREIAWRLREIGADGRICDLIDSQVAAIEGAAAKLSPADLAGALSGAFDRIEGKVAALYAEDLDGEGAGPAAPAPAPVETQVQEPQAVDAVATSETTREPSAAPEAEPKPEATIAEAAPVATSEPPMMATASEATSAPVDAFDAGDEAVLDMVALEMAAPDTDAAYEPKLDVPEFDPSQVQHSQVQQSQAAEDQVRESAAPWEIDVSFASEAAAVEPAAATALPLVTPLQPASEPEPAPSLGSSLLANGIVSRPRPPKPDPLAAIRRMTQTEKIAFFS